MPPGRHPHSCTCKKAEATPIAKTSSVTTINIARMPN
jgi:hypothetical protein